MIHYGHRGDTRGTTTAAEVVRVIDVLVRGRLLVAAGDTVELVHEALIGARPTLRGWLDDEAGDSRLLGDLGAGARRWDASGRPEGMLWSGEPEPPASITRPSTLVVLDGSWSQSRKMMQRVPELRSLQRWSLPSLPGRRSLRASPPGGMSSLEAIAEAIAALEGEELGAAVRELHEALIQKQLAERGYVGPHRGF